MHFKKIGERDWREIWSARITLNYRSLAIEGDDGFRPTTAVFNRDRAEYLLGLYEKLVAPLVAATFQPTADHGN